MLAVGAAVLLAGYGGVWWGYSLLTNNTNSLADLMIPGHYAKSHASAPSATPSGATPLPSSVPPPTTTGQAVQPA